MPAWLTLAIDSFWPMLYAGVTFTIPLTLVSFALGLSLGFIVALARLYGPKPLQYIVRFYVTLDDRSGRIEASLFADSFMAAQALLQNDAMVVVEGEVSNDDFSGGLRLRVKQVMTMEDARTRLAESLRLKVAHDALKGDRLRWLGELITRHRGGCPITLEYTGNDAKAMLQFGNDWAIDPADGLIQALRDQFGRENVFLQYR